MFALSYKTLQVVAMWTILAPLRLVVTATGPLYDHWPNSGCLYDGSYGEVTKQSTQIDPSQLYKFLNLHGSNGKWNWARIGPGEADLSAAYTYAYESVSDTAADVSKREPDIANSLAAVATVTTNEACNRCAQQILYAQDDFYEIYNSRLLFFSCLETQRLQSQAKTSFDTSMLKNQGRGIPYRCQVGLDCHLCQAGITSAAAVAAVVLKMLIRKPAWADSSK